jgi:adenylate cyclase
MGTEIERKFLVNGTDWRVGDGERVRQGYLSRAPERTVRVRVVGDEGFLTIKGANRGIVRAEYEYPIPVADAEALLALCEGPLVEKTRYRVPFGGRLWEVDEFHGENAGLVVAEIELAAADEAPERPPWVGAEVSDDPRYYNASLSRRPFRTW